MKKYLALVLAFALLCALASCSPAPAPAPVQAPAPEPAPIEPAPAPVKAEEVKGATIPAFSVMINGITITQEEMAAYPVYSVQATSVNSSGTESTVTYIGFAIKDVCDAAGLNESYIWLEATANDGYAVNIMGDAVMADTTLLAMTKDGAPFSANPWFAPCSDDVTGNYLKGCVSILVNTKEEAPDVTIPEPKDDAEAAPMEGLPEILDRTDKVEFTPFSFKVNGKDVTNETLEGLSIYKITAVALNSKGSSVESGYTGYKLSDVLSACGIENASVVKAVANDGYETELSPELIESDYTLIAIEKDKELGEDGTIWLAPCSELETKAYCKLVVEIVAE